VTRLLVYLLVAAAGMTAAATAYAGGTSIGIIEAGARFPDRAYVVTLKQATALRPSNVHVFENGVEVSGTRVTSAKASASAAERFAVVLVIDESNSMRGKPIHNALLAARALVKRLPDQRIAVIVFNDTPTRLLGTTADADAIRRVLAQPPALAAGTHIYDALLVAADVLKRARAASGSIVLLSDGADTGSRNSIDDVLRTVQTSHLRIFSTGLKSGAYQAGPLEELARRTGGSYAEASTPGALTPLYDALGQRLQNEYLVQYKSLAGPNRNVHVQVKVGGVSGSADTGYKTAPLPTTALPPFHRSFLDRFFESALSMLLFVLIAAMLVGVAANALLRPRQRTLLKRISQFVRPASFDQGAAPTRADLADRIFSVTEKSLSKTERWARFKQALELAEITVPPLQIVAWTSAATLFAVFVLILITGSFMLGVIGLFAPLITRTLIIRKLREKRQKFAEQLPDNLEVLSSALRAGHSLVGALSVVVEDAPEPSRSEFQRVIADEQLGIPLEEALGVVVRRMENRDLDQVAVVAALQRDTGGNSAEVLDRVTETVRQRAELRRLIQTLTAQGRLSRWVVTFLPVLLLFAILLLNPHYINPLVTHGWGQFLLFMATVMVISGSLVIKRIINIKV
jgi:tight adherence protein B